MGSGNSKPGPERRQRTQQTSSSIANFVGNLSGRSFVSGVSNRSSVSSRPWSRVSRRRWNTSTLTDPLIASKTAWPVPQIESIFLPEFKINTDDHNKQFYILDVISKGAYGKVYKVKQIGTQELFALKVLSKAQILSESAVLQVKDEVHIQEVCGHNPFIVACTLKWQSHKKLFIVSEYISGGELTTLLEKYPCLPEELVRIYVAELALALDFLHNAGVVYRDLKPENILLNASGHFQLIDFGLSKWLKFGCRTSTICGTLQYMAPEILNNEPYGHAADWWALGIVMCRMLTDKYPNPDGDKFEGLTMGVSAKTLLMRLLDPGPLYRLRSLKMIQETAFFKDFNFAAVRSLSVIPNEILKSHFPNGPPKVENVSKEADELFAKFDNFNIES